MSTPTPQPDSLDGLISRLQRAAEQLRSGELSADAAASLVEDCAALAGEAGAELERRTRAAGASAAAGTGHAALSGPRYPEQLRERIDAYLEGLEFAHGADDLSGIEEAMRYSLLAPGKRIRPVLALSTAMAIDADPDGVLPLAAALELIHTYSLIHDDLPAMDDDDLRRGRPTCHVRFGENVAILAGDALYAEAFRHLLEGSLAPAQATLAAARRLTAATGVDGMVGGQYLDVAERAPAGAAGLRRLHALKTGRLIAASIDCVLLLEGKSEPARMAFGRFSAELGVLFQIVDDILDVTGTDQALGKPRGSDERHGKRTYVSEYGLERARALAGESHHAARAALEAAAPAGAADLGAICDFIYTRTS